MAKSKEYSDMSFRVDRGRSVLEGHNRKKKKITPPFASLPFTQVSFTADIFPEMLWLALIFDHFGYHRGIEIATPFQAALYEFDKSKPWHRTSQIAEISADLWSNIKETDGAFKAEVEEALVPIAFAYPKLGMSFFHCEDHDPSDVVGRLKRCVSRFSNRFETPGCALIGSVIFLQAFVGRMQVPRETLEGVNSIVGRPGSEEAELASSMARATLLAMWSADEPHSSEWPKEFWRANRVVAACYTETSDD